MAASRFRVVDRTCKKAYEKALPSHAQSFYAQPSHTQPLHAQPSHAQPSAAQPFPQLPPALSALTPVVVMHLTTEENTSDVFSK